MLATIVVALVSCRDGESSISGNYVEEDMLKVLKVKENSFKSGLTDKHVLTISWDEWGRKSRGCEGWGLCNFSISYSQVKDNTKARRYTSNILVDKNGQKYFSILLGEKPDKAIKEEVLALRVDENISYTFEGVDYTVRKGVYYYDHNLGEYGGYTVSIH